jgi:hypothetical protein
LNVKEIRSNIIKGSIKFLKTCKLGYLAIATIVMVSIVSGDILNVAYNSIQTEKLKSQILMYVEYSNVAKGVIPNVYLRWGILVSVVVVWILILYFRYCYVEPVEKSKKILHVLGHSTLGRTQFKLCEEYSKTLQLDVKELNLLENIEKVKENYDELKYIINTQDNFIAKFKNDINDSDVYGYMGISHTPFIMRAGYQLGDETKFTMLHKKRDKDCYEELRDIDSGILFNIEKKDIKNNCKELIVSISTTFPIQDNQLSILQPENKSVIKFISSELGFDVITSKKQVEAYVSSILTEVRNTVKDKGITKIHMVISSSVTFTFALGQALSNHYDPEVVVYHFDINNPKKYLWGISVFNECRNCVVVN